MAFKQITINTNRIGDWESFHSVFAEVFGFPTFYGRNTNAWIDCMTSLDAPEDGLTRIHVAPGEVLALYLDEVSAFAARCPDIYDSLLECTAFVNYRREQAGPVVALCFEKQSVCTFLTQ